MDGRRGIPREGLAPRGVPRRGSVATPRSEPVTGGPAVGPLDEGAVLADAAEGGPRGSPLPAGLAPRSLPSARPARIPEDHGVVARRLPRARLTARDHALGLPTPLFMLEAVSSEAVSLRHVAGLGRPPLLDIEAARLRVPPLALRPLGIPCGMRAEVST